jgi:hypothetical protein
MDTTCVSWRGPAGSGKRIHLHTQLREWASRIGQPFAPVRRIWDAPLQEQTEDGEDIAATEKSSQAGLPIEISAVHWGFDVARMSLQDKQFVKAILHKWGRGSQVLSTTVPCSRCLVFYHAHLFSSESILFLQAFLELNHRDTVVWFTSEQPVPPRLSDWFLEVPVAGEDRMLKTLKATRVPIIPVYPFEQDVKKLLLSWTKSVPLLEDVKKIRSIVYSFLHRNIRWCEGFHIFVLALNEIDLPAETLLKANRICIQQPYTGAGQTVPSYRIPMLWEHFLLLLRETLAPRAVESAPVVTTTTTKKRKAPVKKSAV